MNLRSITHRLVHLGEMGTLFDQLKDTSTQPEWNAFLGDPELIIDASTWKNGKVIAIAYPQGTDHKELMKGQLN